ncbi:unnamed protein product [Rotaria socialis]|uniref:Uncharacterized protein n=1 Tax=Rotaria socialis TaxID=392032 RepID=A0A821SUU2_9BILA|nr:unnamed protein product [Rotaria socialis]CAF4863684.1 unnamed protein product [Rotaria socialis]CAF4871117.1 unnamed protein product [Rotaria socialis]
MISNTTGTKKLSDDDNDSINSEEDTTEVPVVVEQTPISSSVTVKPEKKKSKIDLSQATSIHKKNMKYYDVNQKLITTRIKPSREKDEIAAAEGVLVYHNIKHGHSYLAQQCLVNVCKTIFSSSPIATGLSCARTKPPSITLNIHFDYSLLYDASNKGNTKVFPFCVQFLSSTGVKKGMVNLIGDAEESANKIFANVRQLIIDNDLDLNGLTALGADNTSVNVGNNHSDYSLFKDELPDIHKDVEHILLSIYSHFSRSAKRIDELKQYYEFYEQDFKAILKHIKIRWLSLYLSIERLVEVFVPVKKYFLEQHENCPLEIKEFFEHAETTCV